MPRPSLYTAKLVDEIADRLATGEPMAVICRDEGMPDDRTVRRWINDNPDVKSAIACAREAGHDAIAARARETARGVGESSGDVPRDRLIIETDLKLLSKWDPRRYGEKVTQEITGDLGVTVTWPLSKPRLDN